LREEATAVATGSGCPVRMAMEGGDETLANTRKIVARPKHFSGRSCTSRTVVIDAKGMRRCLAVKIPLRMTTASSAKEKC
jgi:hypothetical protein